MLLLNKADEKVLLQTLQEATKVLKPELAVQLWNMMLDNIVSKEFVSLDHISHL